MSFSPIQNALPVASIDTGILVYLIGEVVPGSAPMREKRALLMGGLCEWLGGDAWTWSVHEKSSGGTILVDALHYGFSAPPQEWQKLADRHVSRTRTRADGRSVTVAILREPSGQPFSARETRLAGIVFDEISWLYDFDDATHTPAGPPLLTPRQRVVATLMLQGWDRKRIAAHLDISANTLGSHIKEIYRRLGVRSQAGLIKSGYDETIPGRIS
ncbi:MAG: LuxR family transcriptional regulator [Verrucomicrobiaceae bacterium]|nr:MAG: LuxR family transcriptional regulator [Verrucomicrobiaceae bacterium]